MPGFTTVFQNEAPLLKVKIIAHRGASLEHPENTLAAFERAVEIGVDAIEADLLLTSDQKIVVRHDDLVRRNGEWVSVQELSLEELKQLDLGQGERVPSLEELLEHFLSRCRIVLDLKAVGLAQLLAEQVLSNVRSLDRIHVTSSLHAEIGQMGQLCPRVDRSIVLASVPVHFKKLLEDSGVRQVSLYRGHLNENLLQHLRRLSVRVLAYPVNWPQEAQRFASWGVTGIFTDDPAAMMQVLKKQI